MPQLPLPTHLRALAVERHARYAEAAQIQGIPVRELTSLPGDGARVLACSTFIATAITREPALLDDLIESGDLARDYSAACAAGPAEEPTTLPPVTPEPALVARFQKQLWAAGTNNFPTPGDNPAEELSEEQAMQRLRRLRRREWVRLAWRDISAMAKAREMMSEASAFADAAISFSLACVQRILAKRIGQPQGPAGEAGQFVVLALGKLGAGELNFSSDIDLIFAYSHAGETVGARRSLSNNEYFLRLARRLIKLLTEMTPDGTVFRVDMRLRPFGDSGPLVMSFDALEEYYQTHGRDWERYALIRARPISTGEPAADLASNDLMRRLDPFVYRRYLDFGTLELLREMKRSMTDEVERRGLHNNVKLGPGGIREVEFTAQAFQMVRGGRMAALKDRCLLRVLPKLRQLGLLPGFAVHQLECAYDFLRATEHRLQEMDDRQLHELPTEASAQELLAVSMGYATWSRFHADLAKHREHVHEQFVQVFGDDNEETSVAPDPLQALLDPLTEPAPAISLLEDAGFVAATEAFTAITQFTHVYDVRLLDGPGERRLKKLLPDLLRATARQARPLEALERVLSVVQAVVRRSAYLSLLAERPLSLSQLVILCSASPWIARQLARYPALLDQLLDPRDLYAPMTPADLRNDLDTRLEGVAEGDTERELDLVRQFKHAAVLRVAASDLNEQMPLMQVSDYLTDIAEILVERALTFAWRDLRKRFGVPTYEEDGKQQVAPFAIIAYGKLGGIELGYGSDLDLVFIHGGPSGISTDGARAIDAVVFFQRLGQRIIHFLNTATAAGTLYEVDSRLRPSGNKGPLVVRFRALAEYLREDAWTWEHQALVRARVIVGDPKLTTSFEALRTEILSRDRDPNKLRDEVCSMRHRMRAALGNQEPGHFNLKQDSGGIADIEFMVQYCVLRWAERLGEWRKFTDNIRLLEGLSSIGVIESTDAARLTETYKTFRAAVHTQALQEQDGVVDDKTFAEERATVQAIWRSLMGESGSFSGPQG